MRKIKYIGLKIFFLFMNLILRVFIQKLSLIYYQRRLNFVFYIHQY